MRNARQIIGVAAAAFGGELFDDKSAFDPCVDVSSDTHRLACDWRSISAELASVSSYEDISPQWIDKITEVSLRHHVIKALRSPSFFVPSSGFGQRRG